MNIPKIVDPGAFMLQKVIEAKSDSCFESPCCKAKLFYAITRDAYVCRACQKEYDVLSVEHDHVLFNGGPPKEINRKEADK